MAKTPIYVLSEIIIDRGQVSNECELFADLDEAVASLKARRDDYVETRCEVAGYDSEDELGDVIEEDSDMDFICGSVDDDYCSISIDTKYL